MTLRDRLHLIKREFLEVEFPPPYPVRLRVERLSSAERAESLSGVYYYAYRGNPTGLIRIAKGLSRDISVTILNHEWAHVVTELHPGLERHRAEDHDSIFYARLGEIERGYFEWLESNPALR